MPPTNTPLPTSTPLPTATPTPTDTPTPTPEIPAEMSAEMQSKSRRRSARCAACLKRRTIQPDVYDQAELEQYFTGLLEAEYPEEEEFQDLVTLSYLGLIPPDLSLYNFLSALYAEQTFGFYDLRSNQMVLVQGAELDPLNRVAYAMRLCRPGWMQPWIWMARMDITTKPATWYRINALQCKH